MSKISWTEVTWNPIVGCSKISAGCKNCYAEKMAARLATMPHTKERYAQVITNGKWSGKTVLHEPTLLAPLKWKKPRTVFVCSMADLFHESVPNSWIAQVLAIFMVARQHTGLILTKRADRMEMLIRSNDFRADVSHCAARMGLGYKTLDAAWPLPNVHLGVSVEDQKAADERVPHLLELGNAGWKTFVSAEPLLGPVDLRWIAEPDDDRDGVIDAMAGRNWIGGTKGCGFMLDGEEFRPSRPGHEDRIMLRQFVGEPRGKINGLIIGGESGPGARPCNVAWIRSLVRQARDAGVALHLKQLGAKPYQSPEHDGATGYFLALKDPKGGDPSEWPEDLQDPALRAWPNPPARAES